METQGITIEVSDLTRSRDFYENVLGFRPGTHYEPTKWQPYLRGAVLRDPRDRQPEAARRLRHHKLELDDVEALWDRVKDSVDVAEPLATTPYGTYKFVIKDPDGYRLGFVRARKD